MVVFFFWGQIYIHLNVQILSVSFCEFWLMQSVPCVIQTLTKIRNMTVTLESSQILIFSQF